MVWLMAQLALEYVFTVVGSKYLRIALLESQILADDSDNQTASLWWVCYQLRHSSSAIDPQPNYL